MARGVHDEGGRPSLHHDMWTARRKLQAADYGVEMHELCAKAVEMLGTFDQLDIYNVAGIEMLVRKMQLVEHYWDDRRADGAADARLPMDELHAFMGGGRSPPMVCLALLDVVSKELERVYSIKKNAR